MKAAEQTFDNGGHTKAMFNVQKANNILQQANLHETARIAEAAEIRTVIDFLKVDPENDLAGVLSPEEAEQLEVKVRNWLLGQIKTEEIADNDD
jgi:hypothetical protein